MITNMIGWRRQNVQIPVRRLSKNPLTTGNESSNYKKKGGVKIKAEREPKRHRLNDGEEEIGSEICTHLADTRSYSTPSELAWALGRRTRQR